MSRARAYCLTINNYTDDILTKFNETCLSCTYGCFGLEIGNSGTPHIQGYLYVKNKISFNTLKKDFPTAHIEVAKGSPESNKTYCSKQGNFTEFGELPKQGKRKDIEEFRDAIFDGMSRRELLMAFPLEMAKYIKFYQICREEYLAEEAKRQFINNMEPEIIVHYGDPGTGKTLQVYKENEYDNIFKLNVGDGSKDTIWWDGYHGQDVILIDDFNGELPITYLLNLLDRYPMQLSIKGSKVWKIATKIYITSNHKPDQWYGCMTGSHRTALFRRLKHIKEFKKYQ